MPPPPGQHAIGRDLRLYFPDERLPQQPKRGTVANLRSDHSGGVQFLMANGSVHFLSKSIDMVLYRRLAKLAEGTPAALP